MDKTLLNRTAAQIIETAESLERFTYDALCKELSNIPETKIKTLCIDWLLNNPDIEVYHDLYCFKNHE